jgi:tetratricopeptide (TPR) repeat protein
VQRLRGRLDAAAEQTQRVLSEAAQTQEHMLVVLHLNLAQIRLDQGHFEEAATHVKEAERLAIAQGDQAQLPQIHAVAAQIAIAQGDETDAKRRAKEAVTLAKKLGSDHDLSLVLRAVGQVAQATGQREQAVAHWTEAERVARRLGAKRDLAWAMLFRAEAGNGGGPVRLKQMRDLANAIGDESLARRVRQLLRV